MDRRRRAPRRARRGLPSTIDRSAWRGAGALAVAALLLAAGPAAAQTDEIQVYTGEIVDPGAFGLALHVNYTPSGHTSPAFPGGIPPNHALNAVPELALGVAPWAELGLYLPVVTVTGAGELEVDAVKLRALFVTPHGEERRATFGVNFELSWNAPHWDPSRWSGEARFIAAGRFGPIELALNPILDTAFDGIGATELVTASRAAWRLSERWTVAVEEYASLGRLDAIQPLADQAHTLFAVVDLDTKRADVELGVGWGLTASADQLVLKLIVAPGL